MAVRDAESGKLNEELTRQVSIIEKCTIQTEKYGRLILASPPKTRYPYLYPRDTSSAVQLFRRLATSGRKYDVADQVFDLIASTAHFIKDVMSPKGEWGQRYGLDGVNNSIYKQEDNVAHGVAILCNYLLAAHELGKEIDDLGQFLQCINLAVTFAMERLFTRELNLFMSTTSVHESEMERGYTCWVNYSFLHAFMLAAEVAKALDPKGIIPTTKYDCFGKDFAYSVGELFIAGDRYVRRIEPSGGLDMRPDFTLLSPYYYGYLHRDQLDASVEFLEKQLWDPELGMIMRYLPFYLDFSTHVHAGNGPWCQYTAILAQYHYWKGDVEHGDMILGLIDKYKNENGEIPEHVSTPKRFEEFMNREWDTGLDFDKEFYKPMLLDGIEFGKILEEANNMSDSYWDTASKRVFKEKSSEGGYIHFAVPLMWSHVEYSRALLVKSGDWWPATDAE